MASKIFPDTAGVLVDFGLGNLSALQHKLVALDPGVRISSCPDEIAAAQYLILPGVGHFAKAMENLRQSGILPVLEKKVIDQKTPILGICVGMQLFAKSSEEGNAEGLGWIDAQVKKFSSGELKIPHIGWSRLIWLRDELLPEGLEKDQRFYFIHSYRMICADEQNVMAVTQYGDDVVSVVRKDHIFGVQFHPEKSHRKGLRIVDNFLKWARAQAGSTQGAVTTQGAGTTRSAGT